MNHNIELINKLCLSAYHRGFLHGMVAGVLTAVVVWAITR